MKNYQYLIIGGGMTAAAAADGIREVARGGSIIRPAITERVPGCPESARAR